MEAPQCSDFSSCTPFLKENGLFASASLLAQFISGFAAQGNATWARNLYVKAGKDYGLHRVFVFKSHQIEAGGGYIYEPPQEIKSFPTRPLFR